MNMTQTAIATYVPLTSTTSPAYPPRPGHIPGDDVRCITHDLNNSIQITLSTLELLQGRLKRGLTDEMPRLIDQALTAASLASKTGRHLMNVTQSSHTASRKYAVKDIFASIEPVLRNTLGTAVDLILALDSSPSIISCDSCRLQNAFLNLILNAKDAMPNGGLVVVSISREVASSSLAHISGFCVRIVVTDTGHGMTKDVLDRVGTAFFTTKPAGKGTGLGLAGVRSLVDELDGVLDIQSAPGCGTSISLILPCEDPIEDRGDPIEVPTRCAIASPDTAHRIDNHA